MTSVDSPPNETNWLPSICHHPHSLLPPFHFGYRCIVYTGTLIFSHRLNDLSPSFSELLYIPHSDYLHDEIQDRIVPLYCTRNAINTILSSRLKNTNLWQIGNGVLEVVDVDNVLNELHVFEVCRDDDVQKRHSETRSRRALSVKIGFIKNPHHCHWSKSILRGLGKRTRALDVLFTAEHGLDKLGVVQVIEPWRDISREKILEHGDGCLRRVEYTYAAFYIYSAFSYFGFFI